MRLLRCRPRAVLLAACTALAAPSGAQTAPASPPPPSPSPSPLQFSGVLFANYSVTRSTTPAPLANGVDNAFLLERAYLNFRIAAGERTSVRVTTDVYQTTEATPNAYAIRAKFAYLQHEAPRMTNGAALLGRLGLINNVVVDHVETFWPRYISQTAIERAGYFSSADVGVAGLYTLPNRLGEIYGTVVNGPSYTSRERDRFKDYAMRVTLTPLARSASSALAQSFTVTAWGYKGATASAFVNGGADEAEPIGSALDRSRAGVFVGLRDPRLVLGAELSQRHDDVERGANTVASPRTLVATTGRVASGFMIVRPLAFVNAMGTSPLALLARFDRGTPGATTSSLGDGVTTSNAYHIAIGGVSYDINPRLQVALDYQEALTEPGGFATAAPPPAKALFAHFSLGF